jgi:hypothetical protein
MMKRTINRRRAPSSAISSEKKLVGHERENNYAALIGGQVIHGIQKGDIRDKNGKFHSVKSGKKWQVFLYAYKRISNCRTLNILQPCLDAFTDDYNQYIKDREECIGFKEKYVREQGREAAKNLSNDDVVKRLGQNTYMQAKEQLAETTQSVCEKLYDKILLHNFLNEAIFNNEEVEYLAIKDTHYKRDGLFKVFAKEDVLNILVERLSPAISKAGRVPEDYNVAGQKTLLRYQNNRKPKNIVEIEIRNDSSVHYRQVRFNMYSKDTLYLLLSALPSQCLCEGIFVHGQAIETMQL